MIDWLMIVRMVVRAEVEVDVEMVAEVEVDVEMVVEVEVKVEIKMVVEAEVKNEMVVKIEVDVEMVGEVEVKKWSRRRDRGKTETVVFCFIRFEICRLTFPPSVKLHTICNLKTTQF